MNKERFRNWLNNSKSGKNSKNGFLCMVLVFVVLVLLLRRA